MTKQQQRTGLTANGYSRSAFRGKKRRINLWMTSSGCDKSLKLAQMFTELQGFSCSRGDLVQELMTRLWIIHEKPSISEIVQEYEIEVLARDTDFPSQTWIELEEGRRPSTDELKALQKFLWLEELEGLGNIGIERLEEIVARDFPS